MNLVDSSGWLEYFVDGSNADTFEAPILALSELIVPTICLYEVHKIIERQRGDQAAHTAVTLMTKGIVVDLDATLALSAARLGLRHQLPLADSIIYATAQAYDATLWTQDAHFEGLAGVRYVAK